MKSTIAAIILVLAFVSNALAGDFARRHIIGFSKDGSLFAFEEYGIQDGSGFPYSNIYIIDTRTDKWTSGSPFRVRLNDIDESNYDENNLIIQARLAAKLKAGAALNPITQPGLIVASNKPSELSADPHRFLFVPRIVAPPIDRPIVLIINSFPLPGGKQCEGVEETRGFALHKQPFKSNLSVLLHKDDALPKSRFCPLKYSFADVITYHPRSGTAVMAVLIMMRRRGFEGPDGRYLAITAPLNN